MNREIKFRAKCSHCDVWVYGSFVDFGEDETPEIQGFDPYREGEDEWRAISVDRHTVGQYTGVKDINGKEIYEGDIVEVDGDSIDYNTMKMVRHILLVGFHDGSFTLEKEADEHYYLLHFMHVLHPVVLGNIYDNPDLLNNQ